MKATSKIKDSPSNFWNQLESKQLTNQAEVKEYLMAKLGTPTNQIQSNLLQEFSKKANAYYFQPIINNPTTFLLFGSVQEIQTKQYKEGKRMGQNYCLLKLKEPQGETLRASQTDLPVDQWEQLQKSAILGQKLVFKYKKWITNKELLDFYPQTKKDKTLVKAKNKPTKN